MRSIRHRVLWALIAAAIIPSGVILWVSNKGTVAALEASEYAKIDGVGSEIARQVGASMEATRNSLETLETNPILVGRNTPLDRRVDEMERLVNIYKKFSDITIYYPDGHMLKSTTEDHPEPIERTQWFRDARDYKKVVISRPHKVVGLSGLYIKVYIPVPIPGSSQPHILKARMSFDNVKNRIEGAHIAKSGKVTLLDSRGNMLYSRDQGKLLEKFDEELSIKHWRENPQGVYKSAGGEPYMYSASPISASQTQVGEPWTLISFVPQALSTKVIRDSQSIQIGLGLLTLFLAILLGVGLAKGLSDPVVRVSEAALKVSKGELEGRLPVTGSLEIRNLSESFNTMIDEVREHRNKLSSLVERRTERLRDSELRLKKMTAMLLASYEATQEAVLVTDPTGTVVAANRHLGEFFGVDSAKLIGSQVEALRQPMLKCFSTPELFKVEWDRLADDPAAYLESEWELETPEERSLSIYSAPVADREGVHCARLWMFRDTTEQARLQEGLQQAQKMEAVGQLAGGVAHDFNNLLTGILGNLSLVQMGGGTEEGETPDELISTAKGAGERAAELVKQLLGFSRRTHLKVAVEDCNKVIRDVDLLTRRTFDPRITIELDIEEPLWGAKVDINMIDQVVMNMVVNAKDAMTGPGTISMSSRNVTLSEKNLSENVKAAPGDYVAITVADDGEGMSPEVLKKIYEPFFTTKEQGKGTGLGLATSYGIVHQHGGWIDCTSKLGQGTVFTIYLPKAAGELAVKEERDLGSVADRGGSETILLVDDEKVVRTVAQSVLKHHGYKTLAAEDGLVALEYFEKGDEDIDLVLLDLTMPNLSGAETFKRIRAEYGDVPVIVCSGYAVNLDEFEAENGARPNGFVQKPYNIADLAHQVREVLNEACLSA